MSEVLIAIIAIVCLVSYKGFNDRVFFDKYKFNVGAIQSGQKYRMFTSAFLHGDISHLIFNLLTLYFFAPVVIGYFGSISFLIVYFISLVCGSLLSLKIHEKQPYYSAIGASGAITGVLYAAILLNPDAQLGLFFVIPMPAYVFGIGYLLYSIYGMKQQNDLIGHTAHFGGAIGGLLSVLILDYRVLIVHYQMVILLLIPIVILYVMISKGKI
ncbi:rhomboid family intramembrane serine protease [Paenimyroides tangerinum]|uniref:Rhomboid family intramembrane serine protease n=1 Tax=Paenimyroides tangerinum TaxID=2488728 RepID=A0A3P3W9A6_9FLAO|nr:rhomboid family intramembrane serine protease [Paenimyroides tangerinum]RRJ91284.1 rhomboid family intramembrane serine protease [Paenimyroides tangerinum]